ARLRSREQHHRRVRRLRPAQDRRRRRAPAAPHGARRRLHAERGGVTLGPAPLSTRTRLTLWHTATLLGTLIGTSGSSYCLPSFAVWAAASARSSRSVCRSIARAAPCAATSTPSWS